MTVIWFVVWFIANAIGGGEPLTFDPVNGWTGTLLLAIALDLGRAHVPAGRGRASREP
ncbi:MAG: hypothetical protein IRZ32_04945 [Solirubrobacteraceae bacterium]|nr:hypothetical protein [Solirubrobacteraceae bacterium]